VGLALVAVTIGTTSTTMEWLDSKPLMHNRLALGIREC
jgi:hypothetical protein